MACTFCTPAEFKERIYFESPLFYLVLSRSPIRPGHTLVIPKRHQQAFTDLNDDELLELHDLLKTWLPKLLNTFNAVGYNLAINTSPSAGQAIPHLHVHVVLRTEHEDPKFDRVRQIFYRDQVEGQGERVKLTPKEIAEQVTKLSSL